MDLLFDKFNIFKIKDNNESYEDKFDKIFLLDTNILEIYSYIRSENISSSEDKINILREKTKEYIQKRLSVINSVNMCNNILNEISNKLSRIRLLFDYIRNRKQQDLFVKFIEDFYTTCIANIHIFIEHIFKHLINQKTPNYIYETALSSFKLLIDYLNYPFTSLNYINENHDNYKNALEQYTILYNKYTSELLFYFTNTIKLYLISNKTLCYSDLVSDFKLIEKCVQYEKLMSQHLDINIYKLTKNVRKLLSYLPILNIIQNVNIYTTDQIYYDIINNQLEYNPNSNIINYLIRLVKNIESNIIITKEKYKSETLLIELSKIFRIYHKMRINWSLNKEIIESIKKSINNILEYDEILLNYIVTSLIIFVKKININNFSVLKDLAINICSNIAISNKESQFLDIFNQNLQNNSLKTKISYEFYEYINHIVDCFDPIESNYMKIKKFLSEIKVNIDYNKEISKIKVTCNKEISFDINNMNTILINKDIWKIKNSNNTKFKIPNEIAIYFKIYENFYNIKHNYRSIEWSMDHSCIDIDIDGFTISGSILPISILFLISQNKDINFEQLLELLESSNKDLIDNNIKLLESNNIIKCDNNKYIISNIISDINLNKLTIVKKKNTTVAQNDYDINNATDCFIIKIVKPLNGSYLTLNQVYEQLNKINKYFQVTEDFVKTRLDILINKSYIAFKNGVYYYDV